MVEEHISLSAEEQALHRVGQWLGSKNTNQQKMYVLENDKFQLKDVDFNEACTKIIDEIFTNSVDEHIKTFENPKLRGWKLDTIKIDVRENGHITVFDNGGITSNMHSKGMRTIELLFGELFSSSNYDDTKKRKSVGTNGVGGSLANLFSKRFKVISCDGKNKVEVEWSNNKKNKTKAIVTKTKEHYTLIDFEIDLDRFKMKNLTYGILKYMERRCIISSATNLGLNITFNDNEFKFKSFKDYVSLYDENDFLIEENNKWNLYVTPIVGKKSNFHHGVVNGAECNIGTHIDMAKKVINTLLKDKLKDKKIDNLTYDMLSNSYSIYLDIKVDNVEYDAQNKNKLSNDFHEIIDGKRTPFELSNQFKSKIEKSLIFTYLIELSKSQNNLLNSKELKKALKIQKEKSPKDIEKLIDATELNKGKRKNCEFWIFEGNSASSGFRSNRIPSLQGAYSLRGKALNTMDMKLIDALKNQEFSDIFTSIGLDPNNPNDLAKLRYGKFFICTDMDVDGHSICGQLIAFFYNFCPKIIEEGRLFRVITPLWKASKDKDIKYYYTTEEFKKAKNIKGYEISYFKGIGSLEKEDYINMLRRQTILKQFKMTDDCEATLSLYMRKEDGLKDLIFE